jgi:hypothetical protein
MPIFEPLRTAVRQAQARLRTLNGARARRNEGETNNVYPAALRFLALAALIVTSGCGRANGPQHRLPSAIICLAESRSHPSERNLVLVQKGGVNRVVAVVPGDADLLSGSPDGKRAFIRVANGEFARLVSFPDGAMKTLSPPQGYTFYGGARWDATSRKAACTLAPTALSPGPMMGALCIIDGDKGDPHLVGKPIEGLNDVSWSPLGDEIAISSSQGIGVVRTADGTIAYLHSGQLDTMLLSVAWSPTGRDIAFVGMVPSRGSSLAVLNRAQRRSTVLDSGTVIMYPTWSHDGKRLVYVKQNPQRHMQILVCDVPAGTKAPLTPAKDDCEAPRWSRDGKWVLFLRELGHGQKTQARRLGVFSVTTKQIEWLDSVGNVIDAAWGP